jgi:hypothetical protein
MIVSISITECQYEPGLNRSYWQCYACPLHTACEQQLPEFKGKNFAVGEYGLTIETDRKWLYFDNNVWNSKVYEKILAGEVDIVEVELFERRAN